MSNLALMVLDKEYTIHRLDTDANIPAAVFGNHFFLISRTEEELSIVCETNIQIDSAKAQTSSNKRKKLPPSIFLTSSSA